MSVDPTQQPKASSSKGTTHKASTHNRQPSKSEADTSDDEDVEDQESNQGHEDYPDDSDSDKEGNPSRLVHESVAVGDKSKTVSGKVKYAPQEETPEQRDARTVFVGNVPVEVVKSKVRYTRPSTFYRTLNTGPFSADEKAIQPTHPLVHP